MDINDLNRVFDGTDIKDVCRTALEDFSEYIARNIAENKTNSGKSVNALGQPAYTTGETINSLRVVTEHDGDGFSIALVGRKGIMNIDRGNPPAKDSGEFASFNSFYEAIKSWARAKESRYGLPNKSINAYSVAAHVWELGGVLYREGGGTETIQDMIPTVIDNISENVYKMLDNGVYKFLNDQIEIG